MPYVLRKAVLGRWEHDQSRRLTEDGLKYALKELRLNNNRLSVFLVDDRKSNVDRVVAALAATRQSPDIFEYFLLDVNELNDLEINWKVTPMNTTADASVNDVHVDLTISDENKRIDLAQTLRMKGEIGTIPEKKIALMMKRGIAKGELECSKVRIRPNSRFWKLFDDCRNCS